LLFSEHKLGKLFNYHKLEEISKLFESSYTEETIQKIKNFYFNEHEQSSDITKLENTCRVSMLYLFHWNANFIIDESILMFVRSHVIFLCITMY